MNSNLNSHTDNNAILIKVYSAAITQLLTGTTTSNQSAQIWFTRANAGTFQYVLALLNTNDVYTGTYNPTNSTVSNVAKLPTRTEFDTLNSNVNRTKFLVISSANHNTIRISGVTYGSTTTIPCFIGTKFGVMNVSRNGSVVNVPTFYGTDKPTNTITRAQDSDGTFHFDISVDAWTSCLFIWQRSSDGIDANVSISAIDT